MGRKIKAFFRRLKVAASGRFFKLDPKLDNIDLKKMLSVSFSLGWQSVLYFFKRHKILGRVLIFVTVILIILSILFDPFSYLLNREPRVVYGLDSKIEAMLPKKTDKYNSMISFDETEQVFNFNQDYNYTEQLGIGGGPKFSAEIYRAPSKGVVVTDALNNVTLGIKPKFKLESAKRDDNRVIFELPNVEGRKIISLASVGYKEDIIIDHYQRDLMNFRYDLDIPENTTAVLEKDGSIGVYGVTSELLGNVSTSTEEDARLLEEARKNAEKTNLLFSIPTPIIKDSGKGESGATAFFDLDGESLVLRAHNLRDAVYPISIDPSVYVETARKFLRGNEETNVDFDVNNELIQKGTTTGARFDSWTSTQAMPTGLYDGGSVVAGGYIYYVGGHTGAGGSTTTEYTSNGTFSVPVGVTSVTVKAWGGGGGGGGGSDGTYSGGNGGGGGYASAVISTTGDGTDSLAITIGGGGGAGLHDQWTGGGGGGGGHSSVYRSTTPLLIAPGGGGGGGGGDDTNGGAGGAGGDASDGLDGDNAGSSNGGSAATSSSGGSGGATPASPDNDGSSGGSLSGGEGGNGSIGGTGQAGNGGANGGGDGGADTGTDWAGGGGAGSGYYGGGGGGGADDTSGNGSGGAGGGSGVSYLTGTSQDAQSGSGTTPGASGDSERGTAGNGGAGGSANNDGSAGNNGKVVITYTTASSSSVEPSLYWAAVDESSGDITSTNPGDGACSGWCNDTAYDLPEERRAFSLVAYNGFLYAIGGEDDGGNIESTVFIAKLGANGEPSLWHPTDSNKNNWVYWYEDTSGVLSSATRYGAAVAYNNRLYYVGGETSGGVVSTVEYTDFEPTGTLSGWSVLTSLSTARHMHSVEVYNDYLYVVGGDSNTSGSLLNTVDYVRLANDGTFDGSWESTSSFSGARRTNGGDFTTIYGAYLYVSGGCTSVSAGNCQTIGDEIQIASIFADGSLGDFSTDTNETNERLSYGLHSWQGNVYRVGGCDTMNASGECTTPFTATSYGTINPPGEVSTVNITESYGNGNCVGSTPADCDLPATGDSAGQGGQMLSMSVVLNGYLYIIGGCTNFGCSGSSGNVSYAQIGSDGSLQQESTCVANGNSYANGGNSTWCVDATNRVNGTSGISAAGVTIFNNRIYLVGGIDGTNSGTQRIYWNSVNTDGSLSGTWSSTTLSTAGISAYTELSYTYAYARANPNSAGTNPGNLYVIGGCTSFSASAGCSSSYADEVYKCNITTTGSVSGCSTSGQLQIDVELEDESNEGLGLHSGTVYANYIYLIGGYSASVGDRDTVFYAKFDDSNNIVDVESGTAILSNPDDDWIESANDLDVGRRRGWAFGYNGHIYAVGGYDDTGTGIIPFIEWGKLNVSDGSLDPFVTSSITINQRWGLSMVVSNSFAYVIGGCDVGSSPSGCSSFEPSVQTFQLYNNDSGAPASYTEQTGSFETNNSRIGSSTAILDGYIYVAGGETSGTISASSTQVQFAKLNANGTIGTWSDTSASLPNAVAYGQLEVAGGSLYYVGGENNSGTEQSNVYYATPTSGTATDDTIRSTTYKLNSTEFSGTSYTLTLNNNLESDYFVMVAGSTDDTGNEGADSSQIRVDGDPFGNLTATTSSNAIRLERGNSNNNWNGTITVVECISSCSTDGFTLSEVINGESGADGNLPASDLSEDYTLASAHTTNTVPFGGYLGGGLSTVNADDTTTGREGFNATAGVRVRKNSTNQIRVERNNTAGTAYAADITIYVVEWGSNWDVEEVNVDNWSEGGDGVNSTGHYHQETLSSSVVGANTWVWKSPGTSEEWGLGDGAFGKVLTLGDGVADPTGTVSEISLGSRYNAGADVRDDTVYVMEHSSLAVDYRFHAQSGTISFTETVDNSIEPETIATVGNVTSSEGYRIPLFYYSSTGTGTAYARVAGYSNYYTNDSTVSISRDYSGQDNAGWLQSVDFGNMAGDPGIVDVTSWGTASNGLPGARSKHGAAVWNDRIYVVAGIDGSNNETDTVYISPKLSSGGNITSAWATAGTANEPDVDRSGGAVIAYANNLYLLGGNDGSNYLSDVQFASIGYKTGTISQSGTTVTGSGTSWTTSMEGSEIQYPDGSTATVGTVSTATSMTVDASKTVSAGSRYLIDDGSVGDWTFTTNLTQAVSDADGFAENGFMYLFGGRRASSTCTNNSYVAPISANTTIVSGNNPTGIGEWYQTNVEFTGDRYSAGVAYNEGKVYITGGGCGTELTSNQHYIGTLRAQPQVARYSYYVDADSDVFPNSWLLNGLDNNIGARWQFAYRSSTDATNAWGQDTDFGDVTLGSVETYTPKDASGVDTNFARYYYLTISIDASQTFGYPDDVSRGPTIDDLSLFFTSDPNKRLRHGKTFIQGLKQPLDTPCRQSEDPECHLP